MELLLDTCCLLWWWGEPAKLSNKVLDAIRDPENGVVVSAASAWEISTKTRIGKLPMGQVIIARWHDRLREDRFRILGISDGHALLAGTLPGHHRDPFDRMLCAQSIDEGLPVATKDSAFKALGAETFW